MSEINYLKHTTPQVLRIRFKEFKKILKDTVNLSLPQFREYVTSKCSDFDCAEGWKAIENAWYNRTPNLKLNELIKDYLMENVKINDLNR